MPKKPEPLKPLIPLESLKKVVAGLIAVPKDAINKPDAEPKKIASLVARHGFKAAVQFLRFYFDTEERRISIDEAELGGKIFLTLVVQDEILDVAIRRGFEFWKHFTLEERA